MPEPTTGVLGTLGIDWKLFIAQLVNFSVVLFVMWRWVYRPLVKMMDARTKKIEDGLQFSKEAERRMAEAQVERDAMLQETRLKVHQTMDEATKKAEAMRHEKLAQAKTEIEKVVAETKAQIKAEREAAMDTLRSEVASLVTLATAKVAGKLDDKTQHKLVEQAITEIEQV
jgi:F-type H+-transporting ATPase subunit b